ncbi:MAG: hypothetical protein RIC52_13395 [Amphiplicatus sp.]
MARAERRKGRLWLTLFSSFPLRIADRELASAVARHKPMFFPEKAADRTPIDYEATVNGGLLLVPIGDGVKALGDDYARMIEEGLLFDDAEPFGSLMSDARRLPSV